MGALAGEGLYGLCVPTEHGGLGQGPAMFAAVVETLAQACASTAMVYVMHVAAAQPIALSPTLSDRAAVLWTTPPFDHCMFDALPTLAPAKADGFGRALFAMRWDEPAHRRLLELEGLKQWMPPREEGYASLVAALDEQGGW
jgi:alkylation response protein AidB-like acyl-CoA dehydrogenase